MTERVLVGSDTQVLSPVFTGFDETPAACDPAPSVTVVSNVTGETIGSYTGGELEDQTGVYAVSLNSTQHTAALDILTLTWEGSAGRTQTMTQTVEVVGGFYESIPNLRSISSLASKPVAQLRRFRSEIEDICETHRGTAFVPRVAIETFDSGRVRLAHRHVTSILSVSVDGAAQDAGSYEVDPVTRTVTGPRLSGAVSIAYVHGHPHPPQALVEACREYVRAKVTIDSSDANRNPTSVTDLATQQVYRFGTADPKYGRFTGIESVDSRINQVDDERVAVG